MLAIKYLQATKSLNVGIVFAVVYLTAAFVQVIILYSGSALYRCTATLYLNFTAMFCYLEAVTVSETDCVTEII